MFSAEKFAKRRNDGMANWIPVVCYLDSRAEGQILQLTHSWHAQGQATNLNMRDCGLVVLKGRCVVLHFPNEGKGRRQEWRRRVADIHHIFRFTNGKEACKWKVELYQASLRACHVDGRQIREGCFLSLFLSLSPPPL